MNSSNISVLFSSQFWQTSMILLHQCYEFICFGTFKSIDTEFDAGHILPADHRVLFGLSWYVTVRSKRKLLSAMPSTVYNLKFAQW
jgi:hypothetical protein